MRYLVPYVLITLLLNGFLGATVTVSVKYRYAVVVSSEAYGMPEWKLVIDSLIRKHSAQGVSVLFTWYRSVTEVTDELGNFQPDYIGFVARPVSECNSAFVVAVSSLCRKLDDDPYVDAIWGIITGYEPSDVLRAISESLEVKTVVSASGNLLYEPPIERYYQAIGMTCDSYTKTDYLFAECAGKVHTENQRPNNETDRIKIIASWLNGPRLDVSISDKGRIDDPVDCIITGGHGNVNLWQCHYPDAGREGYMRSSEGVLYGAPYSGSAIAINAPTPKIYWCASNCLMGNPNNKNNIVYAAFHSGHAVQMFGFINNASAGDEFMAWGIYDRVTKCAGRVTLPQGFFLSQNNAIFECVNPSGLINTERVKIYMDSTVFYGDPAGDVHFYNTGETAHAYTTDFTFAKDGSTGAAEFTYSFTMNAHDLEYGEGYVYQFRPLHMLPVRIDTGSVVVKSNDGGKALITDNMLIWEMLERGETLKRGKTRKVTWTATCLDRPTSILQHNSQGMSVSKKLEPRILYHPMKGLKFINFGNNTISYCIIDVCGAVCQNGRYSPTSEGSKTIPSLFSFSPGIYIIKAKCNGIRFDKRFAVYR
ncbi:MAG: hypothetical protein JXK07_06325 [Spirochaetes bacterium]|nr:hypothetical protein [Spirochaetota bacterium]